MKLCVITHTAHFHTPQGWQAYGPYVREMDLWMKGEVETLIVAPVAKKSPDAIHQSYANQNISLKRIPAVSLTNFWELIKTVIYGPWVLWQIFRAMQKADHIHLRCPGNIGLAGCVVQLLFPGKQKTAKYAGNWDPDAKQPWSYRLQRRLLSNTSLTKNMKVLVYGQWPDQTSNVLPFMTATYHSHEVAPLVKRDYTQPIRFLFVGSLSKGKRPKYAVELIHALVRAGISCSLDLYGEGTMRQTIQDYVAVNGLEEKIRLHGNQTADTVKQAFKNAHFVVLPSKSEGWPKVLAEGMFWGCIPIATPVSCVPWMLGEGERGIILSLNPVMDLNVIKELIADPSVLGRMAEAGYDWSTQYTIETFQEKIQALIW